MKLISDLKIGSIIKSILYFRSKGKDLQRTFGVRMFDDSEWGNRANSGRFNQKGGQKFVQF